VPRFVKQYADLSSTILLALKAYAADVRSGAFPAQEHTYSMSAEELEQFEAELASSTSHPRRSE
jgi:3-methyl-2-oxobutanoate hydroxymethyltransferase